VGGDIKLVSVQRVEPKLKDVCFGKVKMELLFFSKRSEDSVQKKRRNQGVQLLHRKCGPN